MLNIKPSSVHTSCAHNAGPCWGKMFQPGDLEYTKAWRHAEASYIWVLLDYGVCTQIQCIYGFVGATMGMGNKTKVIA